MTALQQLNSKLEALTKQIESLEDEIATLEQKKITLADLLERKKDLDLSFEVLSEQAEMFSDILADLAVKAAAGGATSGDIKTAYENAEIEPPEIIKQTTSEEVEEEANQRAIA